MPYDHEIIKLGKRYVQVRNKDNGTIKSKKTTIEKAKKQIRLLQYKDYLKRQKNIFDIIYKTKMPQVRKVVRYKVVKNGHTTLFKKKSAAHKRAHGESHTAHHHKHSAVHHHRRRRRIV